MTHHIETLSTLIPAASVVMLAVGILARDAWELVTR